MKPQSARLVDMSKVRSDTTAYKVRKAIYDFLQKGYPVNINDIAKVIAIADAYDAMISERPYQKKRSPFEVMKLLQEGVFGKPLHDGGKNSAWCM